MFHVEVKKDDKFFAELRQLPKDGARKAMARATNDAVKKGKTEFKKAARSIYLIKAAELEGFTKVLRSYPDNLGKGGGLEVASRRLTVGDTHFSSSPKGYVAPSPGKKRRKVKVKIRKDHGWRTLDAGFIPSPVSVHNSKSMVWHRLGDARKPIAPIRTISAAQMLSNEKVAKSVTEAIQKNYEERLKHHIDRELARIKGS